MLRGLPKCQSDIRLYSRPVVERNPSRSALEPSPACGRAFAGLDFHDVSTIKDVLDLALTNEVVAD